MEMKKNMSVAVLQLLQFKIEVCKSKENFISIYLKIYRYKDYFKGGTNKKQLQQLQHCNILLSFS